MRTHSGWTFAVIFWFCVPLATAQTSEELLLKTLKALKKEDPWTGTYEGNTYKLTSGNQLDPGWLLQTPNYWGKSAKEVPFFPYDTSSPNHDPRLGLPYCKSDQDCSKPGSRCVSVADRKVCAGHSDAMLDKIYRDLIRAQTSIDILSLQRDDQRFRGVLTLAADHLAHSGKKVTIRYLLGVPPALPDSQSGGLLLDHLVHEIQGVPGSNVTMVQARMLFRMDPKLLKPLQDWLKKIGLEALGKLLELGSWNHSKVIAVDGRTSIVGGHNLWTDDYLSTSYPVNDLSMRLRGPAARDAHNFANALWRFVCGDAESRATSRMARLGVDPSPKAGCQPKVNLLPEAPAGQTPVLSVGNLGLWNVWAYQNNAAQASVFARSFLMDEAQKSVKVSQQEIATRVPPDSPRGTIVWPKYFMESLGRALVRKVDVYIVLGGDAKGEHSGYSHGIPIRDVGKAIREAVRTTPGAPKGPELNVLLCKRLHLANMRFSQDKEWEGPAHERWIKNHAKMWMIDDHVFYVGADNVYPAALQEFGYIVGGKAETQVLLDEYWDPLWQWSQATAVSGSDTLPCMFNEVSEGAGEGVPQARGTGS